MTDGSASAAADVLRVALDNHDDPVIVKLTLSRATAEKFVILLEAEQVSGAFVVPVKEMYTTTEAAGMLGISRPTLMKLLAKGQLESELVGTHRRIPVQAVVAFQQDRELSRSRAAESLSELSVRRGGTYQSNVRFRADDRGVSREGESNERQ